MVFRRMIVVDDNELLRRIAGLGGRSVGDTRTFDKSDYYLSKEFVNQFKDEVKSKTAPSCAEASEHEREWEDEEARESVDDTEEMLGTSVGPVSAPRCTDNWKSAAAENKKRMWGIFREMGLFASACRHGFILWHIDMIQSREL